MDLKSRTWLVIAGISACLALCAPGGDFAQPASGPVAFRRDRLPLAVGTMTGLSRSLEMIARSLPGESAAERQAAARALALATALDPSNEEPGKLLGIYQNGGRPQKPEAAALAGSQARIWQLIAWLETPEAGTHGQILAFCLKDVMAVADPKHPRAVALREAGDKGAWAGWVPEISAYEARGAEAVSKPAPESTSRPETPKESSKASVIPLRKASLQTVFWQRNNASWSLGPAELFMSANSNPDPNDTRFSVRIGSDYESESLAQSARVVRRAVENQHQILPRGVTVRIKSDAMDRAASSGRIPEITASAAVLASAAVTGREPEAVIIGKVDEAGAFKLPARFWDLLQALGPGDGSRLVLPAAAAEWLPALIAMENPGFFLDHEVLLAADFRQLLDLSAKMPDGSAADAAAKFREIRERAQGQDIRSYLANRFVRERLDELSKAAPFHASAAMLLLQGTSDRPRLVSRAVLASELRLAIEPMAWIAKLDSLEPNDPQIAKFDGMHDACKDRIDRIERYSNRTDIDLLERAKAVDSSLRRLERAARGRGEYYLVQQEMQDARAEFTRLYRDLTEELTRACGDAVR